MSLEKNERLIEPIKTWSNGVLYTSNIISIDGYSGYDFKEQAGEVQYSLISHDSGTGNKISVIQGIVRLTFSTVENWGSDDQIIFNYVANKLNIVLI